MPSFLPADERLMRRALALAARGQGRVEPNPMVGCVLVRSGRVIGEGYHHRFGGTHAEVEALRSVEGTARGATAYVTLEPCCHFGKTPPCTEALIAAGVRRVVAAMADPFPKVRGGGVRQLRANGIQVELGLLEAPARLLNAPYLKRQRTGRPWVILKWAQSIDGRIATRSGDSKWISSETSRAWVHRLRGRVDGVLVGVGTVLADDPQLTCRVGRPRRIAIRIVLDPALRMPRRAALIRSAREVPTLIITDSRMSRSAKAALLQRSGAEVRGLRCGRSGLKLGELLDELGARGMTNLLVEGGGQTLGRFVDGGAADEALVFISRRLIGGSEAIPALAGEGVARIAHAHVPKATRLTRCGEDDVYQLRFSDPQ